MLYQKFIRSLKPFNCITKVCTLFTNKSEGWRSRTCGELRLHHQDEQVTLCGWLQYNRGGKFFTLFDRFGATQFLVVSENLRGKIDGVSTRSVLRVQGRVQARPKDQINTHMATGAVEVEVTDFQVVNPCTTDLPFTSKDTKVREALRMEYRVLDLARPNMVHNLLLRHQVTLDILQHLRNEGFIYMETPNLYGGTIGGAAEFELKPGLSGRSYFLTQSPQLYKQLLMVAGYDRYFQLARCFRDEGTKPDRQPEFSQVDLEMSFTSVEQVQEVTEQMVRASWPQHLPPLDPAPFPHCSYAEAMELYGTDKPDMRYTMKIQDVTPEFRKLGLRFIADALGEEGATVRAVVIPQGAKHIKKMDMEEFKSKYSQLLDGKLNLLEIYLKSDGTWKSPVAKLVSPELQLEVNMSLGAGPMDLVVASAGPWTSVVRVLGKVRTFYADKLQAAGAGLYDPQSFKFLWVENFPMFERGDQGQLESVHHPFTAPQPEDLPLLYTSPEKAVSQHYDLVLNGQEIAGGSIRIYDHQLQRHVLENILKLELTHSFQVLLEALRCGAPPHGGIALGLDRLVAILCQVPSIRDVLAFPKAPDYSDPMIRRLEKQARTDQTDRT